MLIFLTICQKKKLQIILKIYNNEMVEFELGFISFTAYQTQAFGHQTSVHNIDGTLRYYNGMQNDGDLQNIPANIMTDKFEMDQVYYFRK